MKSDHLCVHVHVHVVTKKKNLIFNLAWYFLTLLTGQAPLKLTQGGLISPLCCEYSRRDQNRPITLEAFHVLWAYRFQER